MSPRRESTSDRRRAQADASAPARIGRAKNERGRGPDVEPEEGPAPEDLDVSRITTLFDEYRNDRDGGHSPNVEHFLERAGEGREELRDRIRVFEELHALSREIDPDAPNLPSRLGRFRILRELGRGGLGRVYLARDPNLGRDVALKVLDRGLVPDQRERAWILREAQSLAVLRHGGVVGVFEVGTADGFDYVVMEHLTGPTLSQIVREWKKLELGPEGLEASPSETRALALSLFDLDARVECFHRIASALAYCHNRGVIHRDVKPENVVFDVRGRPKLIDFGLAHLEDRGARTPPEGLSPASSSMERSVGVTAELIGSAAYIAPEQVASNQTGTDPRSDQFALCTVFYEALALDNPFEAETPQMTTRRVLECDVPPLRKRNPRVPRDLATVIHRGLAREPDERYPTVQALAADLLAVKERRPISVEPPSLAHRVDLWARRNRRSIVLSALGALILVLALGFSWTTRALAERDALLSELSSIDWEGLDRPEEFFESARILDRLLVNANSADAAFGRSLLGDPVGDEVRAAIEDWSRRLGVAFAASPYRETDDAWRLVFLFDDTLCPDCPFNAVERRRGSVALPTLAELDGKHALLQRAVDLSKRPGASPVFALLTAFENVEVSSNPIDLPTGSYRLVVWEDGASDVFSEAEFVVAREWAPEREIRFFPRDPATLADTEYVAARAIDIAGGATFELGAVRLGRSPVTMGEFRRYLASDEYARYLEESGRVSASIEPGVSDDAPALCDLDVAMSYARWVGGRLPRNEELWVADRLGLIDRPETYREWCSNVSWLTGSWNGSMFSTESEETADALIGLAYNVDRTMLPNRRGEFPVFRVAYSAKAPPATGE